MAASQSDEEIVPVRQAGPARVVPARHALREQDALWADFLALASSVVDALEKSVQAICEERFDLIEEVENEEEYSDRQEVMIEQECLRILALYEPLASDLRRMATVLKVNRDWERIADLALRVARRAQKAVAFLLRRGHARAAQATGSRRAGPGSLVLARHCKRRRRGGPRRDRRRQQDRRPVPRPAKELKAQMSQHPEQLDAWLLLLNSARNLERIADHAVGIAQTIVYLKEGVIIRHTPQHRPPRVLNGWVMLLADHRDGHPLLSKERPFQIIVPGEKRLSRWVRQVVAADRQDMALVLLEHAPDS